MNTKDEEHPPIRGLWQISSKEQTLMKYYKWCNQV